MAIIQSVPEAAFRAAAHLRIRLFAQRRNAVQVQRWLGHHSPAFTLSVYVHLLNDDLGGPLSAPSPAPGRAQAVPLAA